MRRSVRRRIELRVWARESATLPWTEAPEDWPTCWRIEAPGLWPLQHGDYATGFSAPFATINAARILIHRRATLTAKDEQALLAWAWRWSSGRVALEPSRGVRRNDFVRLVTCVVERLNGSHGQFVTVSQPWPQRQPSREEFFITLERLIVGGHVLIAMFKGAHYSVIRGYTAESLLLFDSDGACWVKRGCVAVGSRPAAARYALIPGATIALRRSN